MPASMVGGWEWQTHSYILLMGISPAIMEISAEVPQKSKNRNVLSNYITLGHKHESKSSYNRDKLHAHVYYSIIHDSHAMESA
jgi:hypothetical protein